MKTNGSYALKRGGALYSRMVVISIIVALLVSFLPAVNAFAAPASDGTTSTGNLELEWKNKLSHLRGENLFFTQVRFFPADFEDPDDLSRANELLDKYGFALRQANAIVLTHTGFDQKGHILNDIQADQTVKDVAMYLHIMRGLRTKIDEEGYPVRRLR